MTHGGKSHSLFCFFLFSNEPSYAFYSLNLKTKYKTNNYKCQVKKFHFYYLFYRNVNIIASSGKSFLCRYKKSPVLNRALNSVYLNIRRFIFRFTYLVKTQFVFFLHFDLNNTAFTEISFKYLVGNRILNIFLYGAF